MVKRKDYSFMIGSKYNYLTPIDIVIKGQRSWCVFKCDCGNTKGCQPCDILVNKVKSCGCYNIKSATERGYKHHLSNTKFYKVYHHIKKRCYDNKRLEYKNYGGRGIQCLRKTFESFVEDMYNSYIDIIMEGKSPSIERIDNDGHYCKENCKWIDLPEQAKNRRMNYNVFGLTLTDRCKENNVGYPGAICMIKRHGIDKKDTSAIENLLYTKYISKVG